MRKPLGFAILTGLLYAGCVADDSECNAPSDCPSQTVCDVAFGICVPAVLEAGSAEPCTVPRDCASGETCTAAGECRPGSCTFHDCVAGYSCLAIDGIFQCAVADAG